MTLHARPKFKSRISSNNLSVLLSFGRIAISPALCARARTGILPRCSSGRFASASLAFLSLVSSSSNARLGIATAPFSMPKISSINPSYVSCVHSGVTMSTSRSIKTIISIRESPSTPGSTCSGSSSACPPRRSSSINCATLCAISPFPLTTCARPVTSR